MEALMTIEVGNSGGGGGYQGNRPPGAGGQRPPQELAIKEIVQVDQEIIVQVLDLLWLKEKIKKLIKMKFKIK